MAIFEVNNTDEVQGRHQDILACRVPTPQRQRVAVLLWTKEFQSSSQQRHPQEASMIPENQR